MNKTLNTLALAVLLAGFTTLASGEEAKKVTPAAQDATPLWASVPETISPEWGAFFSKKGQGRETPMPAPDDLEAWNAVQAANDKAKEPVADERPPRLA